MRQYLESKHGIIVERAPGPIQVETGHQLQQLYIWAESSGQTDKIDTQVFRKRLGQEVIDKALLNFRTKTSIPYC